LFFFFFFFFFFFGALKTYSPKSKTVPLYIVVTSVVCLFKVGTKLHVPVV